MEILLAQIGFAQNNMLYITTLHPLQTICNLNIHTHKKKKDWCVSTMTPKRLDIILKKRF